MTQWFNLFNLGISFLIFIFVCALLLIVGSVVWFKFNKKD